MSFRSIAILSLFLAASPMLEAQSAALVATYTFQNNLNALQPGAPALNGINPQNANGYVTDTVLGQQRTVYQMVSARPSPSQNAGLQFNTTNLLNPNSYSIEMLFAFTEGNNAFRRIIDNQERTSDRGLYFNAQNRFEFSRLGSGTYVYPTGQYVHMVMVVSDNRARIYANGNLDINLSTNSMNITSPSRLLNLFLDNSTDTSTGDFFNARIALLRAYTNALTADEAQQLAANPFTATVGAGAPSFQTSGVRNGATFSESTPIAPGAFFSIFGSALSDATSDWTGRFDGSNAPTLLNGTRVLINDRPAFLSFTSPGQLNAIAPDGIAAGNVTVVVEKNGVRSAPVTAQARAVNPAFFTYDQRNRRFIAALAADNSAYIAPADLFGVSTVNGLAVRPARPGDFVVAYGMGMGPTTPNLAAGTIPPVREGGHPVSGTVILRFGTQTITPLYAGLSSFAGVYVVGFQVPSVSPGDYELQITINGVQSPTGVVIPVAP